MTDLPAYLKNIPSRNLAKTALSNVGMGAPPYLSIQGNRFNLVDATGEKIAIPTHHVDVVVVDVNEHVSKIFFGKDKPFDPSNPSPPICFSDNGVAPSQAASQPQSPTCAACPNNVWGSKISQMGSAVKQCADQQKVAVYVPEINENIYLLRIPPGSFLNWRAYTAKFNNSSLDLDKVVTRITFQPNVVGTLQFKAMSYVTEQQVQTVLAMLDAKVADPIIGRLDQPRQGALPKPLEDTPFEQASIAPRQETAPVRKRRTKAEIEAAQQQPTQAPFMPDPPPSGNSQFGIAKEAPSPPAGLDLDAVFK